VDEAYMLMGRRATHMLLVGNSAMKKRPLVKPDRRWMDNIKMDLLDIGCGGVNWIGLAQDTAK
jgi:hypothetical protein